VEPVEAGGHNLLLVGPPGAGETLAARALPGILPPLSLAEALEVARRPSALRVRPISTVLLSNPCRSW
jgi:magnesium chelatase family protein